MRIAVIDGQGGGIGKAIVERIRLTFGNELEIIALGTNALAASLMMKAGANECASGENSIRYNMPRVDVVFGSIGIIAANAMIGELTPDMAAAIASSEALKILIPLNKYKIKVVGVRNEPLPHFIDEAMEVLKKYMEDEKNV